MAFGTIVVQTRTSDAFLPVAEATVAFYEPGEDGLPKLLALRQTDESGLTQPAEFPTSAREDSQQPENVKPYRTVNIIADHPGFVPVRVEGVQVFAGIQTLQNIAMLPLPPGFVGNNIIKIPDQNL